MSNYFKQNTRFGILNEEINGNKVFKKDDRRDNRKDDRKDDRRDNRKDDRKDDTFNKLNKLSYREKQFANSAFKEEQFLKNEKKRLEEEKQKNLSMESFPELVKLSTNSTTINSNIPSFLEKITTKVKKEEEEPKNEKQLFTETLKPGWALFTFDKGINKTTMIEKRIIKNDEKSLNELDITYNVFDALANLHENRRQEYINNWGEDAYEEMYIFPNYDYNYFDKLDEKYEEEMIKYNNAVGQQYEDYYED